MPLQKITLNRRAIQLLRDHMRATQLQIEALEALEPIPKIDDREYSYTDRNGKKWVFDGQGNKKKRGKK